MDKEEKRLKDKATKMLQDLPKDELVVFRQLCMEEDFKHKRSSKKDLPLYISIGDEPGNVLVEYNNLHKLLNEILFN